MSAEHSPKAARNETGLFAWFRVFPRPTKSGASSARLAGSSDDQTARDGRGALARKRASLASSALGAVAAVSAVLSFVAPAPALAAGPPQLNGNFGAELIGSTRVLLGTGGAENGSKTSWRIEYATSQGALEGGSGILAGSGPNFREHVPYAEVHNLTPLTTYYARIVAVNSFGSAEETTKFTTRAVAIPEIGNLTAFAASKSATLFVTEVETNGLQTEYSFEYATSEHGPWSPAPGCSGTVTVAEDFVADRSCHLEGLTPETEYFLRVTATNEKGSAQGLTHFTTESPYPSQVNAHYLFGAATSTSEFVSGSFNPQSSETSWRIEYATSTAGPWTLGAGGVVPAAEAGEYLSHVGPLEISGLDPGTVYYIRTVAENIFGSVTSAPEHFETLGPPLASTFAVHALHGEAIRALGAVTPRTVPVDELQSVMVGGGATGGTYTLSFAGQTTAPIPLHATRDQAQEALAALSTIGHGAYGTDVEVLPPEPSGDYAVAFDQSMGGVDQPQLTADASGLTPSGTVTVTTQQSGFSYDTHYHFQYVSQGKFSKTAWGEAAETPSVDAGPGASNGSSFDTSFVGADLPGLLPGEAYRYRLLATSDTLGNPVVDGGEQTVTVPEPPAAEEPSACPNQALRTGPSAHLPDCRAYEQVTPKNKEGASEPFHFGTLQSGNAGALVGADGEHLLLEERLTHWGSGPDAGASPYLFSRTSAGWQMTSGAPQPEAGEAIYNPQVFNPDLTQGGLISEIRGLTGSKTVEYKAGPVGGPYAVFSAPFPMNGTENEVGWVAAAAGADKLILQTGDHTLVSGHPTGTASGFDLYEYSEGGLRQANVLSDGAPLGSCGATIVHGYEAHSHLASSHAVSVDGRRVFFEAVPGSDCSEPSHLYMREAAVERTLDLGAYRFLAANAQGSELLLEKRVGEARELFLYDTESLATTFLFSLHSEPSGFVVSEEFTAIYFHSGEHLTAEAPPASSEGNEIYIYRYDLSARALRFVLQVTHPIQTPEQSFVSPDGRYLYFSEQVGGFSPGGSIASGNDAGLEAPQALRYDSVEDVVQCLSCASPFDPEPRHEAFFAGGEGVAARGQNQIANDGAPAAVVASANGDVVFFDSVAALVPQDVDGEVAPIERGASAGEQGEDASTSYSVSSDVYEWRRGGTGGCDRTLGCLSLISSGRGGKLVALLGTTDSGRDVFFTSAAQLGPNDDDQAVDIYDAREGGGEAPLAPRPVECEGDACSTPFAAPNDLTPASATFHGAGDVPGALPEAKPRPGSHAKPKVKRKGKRKSQSKPKRRSRRASAKRVIHRHHGGAK